MRRLINLMLAVLLIGVLVVTTYPISGGAAFEKNQAQTPSAPAAAAPAKADMEAEKYAVYSALIKDMYVRDNVNLLVISQETFCFRPADDNQLDLWQIRFEEDLIKRFDSKLTRELADTFFAKQKDCFSLGQRLDIPIKYVLVPARDIKAFFKPEGEPSLDRMWERFYEKYTGSPGIIILSNVGFNGELSQALVSTDKSCGSFCGEEYYVLLTKQQGTWKVQAKIMTLVA